MQGDHTIGVTGGWVVDVVVLGTAGAWCRCAGAVRAAGEPGTPQPAATSAPASDDEEQHGRPRRHPAQRCTRRARSSSHPTPFRETINDLFRLFLDIPRRIHGGVGGAPDRLVCAKSSPFSHVRDPENDDRHDRHPGTGRRVRSGGVRAPAGQGRGAPAGGVRAIGTARPELSPARSGPPRPGAAAPTARSASGAGSTMPSDGTAWCCTTGRSAVGAPTSTTSWWCPRESGWSTPSTTGARSSGGTPSGGSSRGPASSWPVATGPRWRRRRAASRHWSPRQLGAGPLVRAALCFTGVERALFTRPFIVRGSARHLAEGARPDAGRARIARACRAACVADRLARAFPPSTSLTTRPAAPPTGPPAPRPAR